jgi:hypothetical protein
VSPPRRARWRRALTIVLLVPALACVTWAALFRCYVLALFCLASGALASACLLARRRAWLVPAALVTVAAGATGWRIPVREVDRSIARLALLDRSPRAFSLRDKLGVYGLNVAMGISGLLLYPEAAQETLWLMVPTSSGRRHFSSDFAAASLPIARVFKSFERQIVETTETDRIVLPQAHVAWSSAPSPSDLGSPDVRALLALNPCNVAGVARRRGDAWQLDVSIEVRVAYPRQSRTCLLRDPQLCVEEGLFWVLQEAGWLHPYTAVWTFQREVRATAARP